MTVLVKLIQEREQWAALQKANNARRSRVAAVEFGLLLVMGLMVFLYYHRILAGVMVLLGM